MHAATPTEGQKAAGNYRMGHIRVHGLDITIETPKGRRRRPEWPPLACHYGYFKRTEARDGDHVDVFIGPNRDSELIYVIDQMGRSGNRFDESKVLMAFNSQSEAVEAYKACYTTDWKVGPVTAMTIGQFKAWLTEGDTMKPIALQVSKYTELADLHLPYDPAPFIERYQSQCEKERYEWVESAHPRHEAGAPGGVGGQFSGSSRMGGSASSGPGYIALQKQFHPTMKSFGEENAEIAARGAKVASMPGLTKSSKIRDVASPPDIAREHDLHWSKAGEFSKKIFDWHLALNRELREMTLPYTAGASGEERAQKWEQAWQAGDKTKIRELLSQMNAMDKEARAQGINLAPIINANGLIPRELAERLSGGSRFFDPERIRDKIQEGNKKAGIVAKPFVPKPKPLPAIFTGNKRVMTDAPQNKSSQEQSKSEPSAEPTKPPNIAAAIQSAFSRLRPQEQKKIDEAIRSLDEDMPSDMVADMRDTVMDAWKQATQETSEYNAALREVMGQSGQNWGARISARLAKGVDYDKIKGFDQLAEYAATHYPHLLSQGSGESDSGSNEESLAKALQRGVREVPQPWSDEVMSRVRQQVQAALGASKRGPIEIDESVPFSVRDLVDKLRYALGAA